MLKVSNIQTKNNAEYEHSVLQAIEEDLNLFYQANNKIHSKSDLWQYRLENKRHLFLNKNKINEIYFKNFRSIRERLIADTPITNNFIKKIIYRSDIKFANMQFDKIMHSDKFQSNEMSDSLNQNKFDLIGNPGYIITNNFIYSERYLRHCHYMNLFRKIIAPEISDNKYILFDIGGGYGIFDKFIINNYKNIKPVIVDLPEQLFNASYYLRSNFPNLNINSISEAENTIELGNDFFNKFDVCLIPASKFKNVTINKNIIIANFNSFGEMGNDVFKNYKNSIPFKNLDYLFTLNRIDSFPTYSNRLSILDYELERYNNLHLEISGLFDHFVVRKQYIRTEIKSFSSRCFEFIGKAKI